LVFPWPSIRIHGERLWSSLMEMAKVGATARGGCNRQALTDEDRAGRDLFVSWARAAGCAVAIDEVGNLFASRPGTDASLVPVLIGSHLDTQATGGRFDGVYGVLAGLEVLRTLNSRRPR
jgi:beta-ureidopropionase / N-carbamoyl-L-amino-acid hydrolase